MNTTSRADFLIYLSIFLLFSHNHRVKSIRIINVDRVLPFHLNNRNNFRDINNIRERDINNFNVPTENTQKRSPVWSGLLSFPSKRNQQQKKFETTVQMKNGTIGNIGKLITQSPDQVDRTLHVIGDFLGSIFKPNEVGDNNIL